MGHRAQRKEDRERNIGKDRYLKEEIGLGIDKSWLSLGFKI